MNKIYATDLTDTRWNTIVHLFDVNRSRKYPLYLIWSAIFYLLKTGCQWRMLPKDYPRWELVYYYYQKWRDDGTIEEVHEVFLAYSFLPKKPSIRVDIIEDSQLTIF